MHVYSGTHGYMAPEVLAKGVAYDSSADWFSFGCMLYKLLRGSVTDTVSLSLIGWTVFRLNCIASLLPDNYEYLVTLRKELSLLFIDTEFVQALYKFMYSKTAF